MAEKQKLKDTDEILNSLGKKRRAQPPKPAVLEGDILPPPIESAEQPKPARRKRAAAASQAGELDGQNDPKRPEEPVEDRNPLDFGKYELPKPAKKPRTKSKPPVVTEDDEEIAAPIAAEIVGAVSPRSAAEAEKRQEAPTKKPARKRTAKAKASPAGVAEGEAPLPVIAKGGEVEAKVFEFEDMEEISRRDETEKALLQAAKEAEEAAQLEAEARKRAAEAEQAARKAEEEAMRKASEAAEARRIAEEAARREIEEAQAAARRQAEEAAEAARLAEEAEQRRIAKAAEIVRKEEEARSKMLVDDDYREDVMDRLGSQFEEAFLSKFDGEEQDDFQARARWKEGREAARQKKQTPPQPDPEPEQDMRPVLHFPSAESDVPPRPRRESVPASRGELAESTPGAATPDPDDKHAALEADAFMQMFEQEVLQEEEHRQEDFKETLAQKFLRERERYLQELGIAEQMEAEQESEPQEPAPQEPPRRKLDFHIQPEMHLGAGEAPPLRPVTYTRAAAVEPQQPADNTIVLPMPDLDQAPDMGGGKKSAEQLVLELAAQNKQRERRVKTAGKPRQFHFRFSPVGEEEQEDRGAGLMRRPRSPRSKYMTKVIALSATAGFLVLALIGFAISTALNRDMTAPEGDGQFVAVTGERYEAYANYTADAGATYDNVLVKRSGIRLGNLTVNESIVVEEEATAQGSLTLDNVTANMIYVKNSGVDALELQDVQADRLVINNANATVNIKTSGATSIGTVELRTTTAIEQGALADDFNGVRNVVVSSDVGASALSVDLGGGSFQSLSTQGETVANLNSATIDTMTAEGNLSLTGTGRVQTLSAGTKTGAGAGDLIDAQPLSLLIKGVEVGHLNIKSPANVNISTQVDSIAAADSVNLGGNGVVGSLVFNEKFGNGRIAVDISGINVQQLTTNCEALIYSSGSSTINMLTANQSTYALGNKVNFLVANADGVIYENEPDNRRVAAGVAQPQSKADNPNLNYNLSTLENDTPLDTTADSIATTCDHAREVGGFLLGSGSLENPFVVENAAQLAHISQHPSSHYVQGGDIDIADDSSFAGGFAMICSTGTRFTGVYDGQGYSIRNLRINGDGENVGLFAENTGTIRNVHIQSGEINGGTKSYVGGVVGFNYQGGQVIACSNGAAINAPDSAYTGGIVGYNYSGKVRDCYNTAKISGGDAVGGIVGMNRQSASVTGSYNVGVIEGGGILVGAIAGSNEEAVVTNCYYLETSEEEDMDGIGSGSGNTVAVTSDRLGSGQMAADLAAGNDDSLWQASGDSAYPYPTHRRLSQGPVTAAAGISTPTTSGSQVPSEEDDYVTADSADEDDPLEVDD